MERVQRSRDMKDSFWVAEPWLKPSPKDTSSRISVRSQDEYSAQVEEAEQWEKVVDGQTASLPVRYPRNKLHFVMFIEKKKNRSIHCNHSGKNQAAFYPKYFEKRLEWELHIKDNFRVAKKKKSFQKYQRQCEKQQNINVRSTEIHLRELYA